jgi:hypothetical protein
MTTPQPANGEKQSAMVNLSIAMDLMEQSLPALGSESEEGRAVLSVLSTLSRKFGGARNKSKDLIPAELQQLMQGLKPSPVAQAMQGAAGAGMTPQMPGGMPPMMPH